MKRISVAIVLCALVSGCVAPAAREDQVLTADMLQRAQAALPDASFDNLTLHQRAQIYFLLQEQDWDEARDLKTGLEAILARPSSCGFLRRCR